MLVSLNQSTNTNELVTISYYFHIKDLGLVQLWIKYGKENKLRNIYVHKVAETSGKIIN